MKHIGRWGAVVVALAAFAVAGCKKESKAGAGKEQPAAQATKQTKKEAPAPEKAEQAANTKEAATPKKPTPPPTPTPAPTVDEATKKKIIAAAIDLGCLAKKAGLPEASPEEASAVVGSVGLALDRFKELWAKVANDPAVKKQVDEAVAQCPSKEDLQRAAVIGIIVQNRCLQQAKVKPERAGALKKEALANAGLTAAQFVALRDKFKADPEFKARVLEGIKHCPPIDPKDLVTEQEAKAKVAKKAPLRAKFFGHAFGSANGKLTVAIEGSKATGVAQFKAGSVPLGGRVLKGGKVILQGTRGGNFFRAFGRLDATKTKISGTWVATLAGKKRQGSFVVSR